MFLEDEGRVAYIEVSRIAKSFSVGAAPRPVLRDVSLSVERGEFVSIVGAMGSGKSTLLSIVAGLTPADAGTITVGGEPVRAVRTDAAFVFQNYSLLPWFTALENVRLAVEASCPGLSRADQKARATQALEQVGLGNALNRRPRQLSGGMRQRVAIARAFATDPDLLFMDEPFGALDALTRETLQGELMRLCGADLLDRRSSPSEGGYGPRGPSVTTIMITNSVEEALLLSDRIIPILPGPPATLGAPIAVDLPRGRTVAQLAHDEQASHVRAHVVARLTTALHGRSRPAHTTPGVVFPETEKAKPGLVFP